MFDVTARRGRGTAQRQEEPDQPRLSARPVPALSAYAYQKASSLLLANTDRPLFRPLKHNGHASQLRRPMDSDAIDRVVRRHAGALGLTHGHSAHSMRATFITTALENGAQLEDVQKAAGHRDPSTTKLYDRRGYNPEKAASFLRRTKAGSQLDFGHFW